MEKHLIIPISTFFLLFFSCCKVSYKEGTLQPEWTVEIPTGTSGEIFYDGIPNMPKYGDLIIAHTTIADEGLFAEDNRLCAINVKTGKIEWYYPSDLEERHYAHFDAKGYLFKNKLIFQYSKDYKTFSERWYRTTVCLNVEDGSVLWEKEGRTTNKDIPSVGRNHECFFVPDSCHVYKANLETNQIEQFYNTGNKDIVINDISLSGDYLVLSCYSHSTEEYQFETYVTILDITTGDVIFDRHLGISDVPSHSCLENGRLYANRETYLAAIDIHTGETLWERDDYWTYTLFDLHLYKDVLLKCAGNATTAYDKNTGEILYDYRNYGSWYSSLHGKYVYLVNRKCKIDIIDIETGTKLDQIVCPYGRQGFFGSYPVIYDDKMYIMGGTNRLFRYPVYPWK